VALMARWLAIDLGDKRTGFAAGDEIVRLVQPLFVAEAPSRAAQLKAALRAIDEYGPNGVVIGLPYNMDGTEGPRAKLVRAFADELRAALPAFPRVAIEFHDERLSSFAAEERLNRSGRTHGEKKALRDALAACAILEEFLAARCGPAGGGRAGDDEGHGWDRGEDRGDADDEDDLGADDR
jgi:putative Holliday junction resolvase